MNAAQLPNLHCHFDRWAAAAADGRLTPAQQATFDRHLRGCTHCMRQCQHERTLAQTQARLEAEGAFDNALETCLVVGFRQDVAFAAKHPRFTLSRRLRALIAIAASCVILINLANPNLDAVVADAAIVKTVQEVILASPNYQQIAESAKIAAEDRLPLAALHKLATMLAQTLAWIALLLVARASIIERLRSRQQQPVPAKG